jgi:hypothetical protein
LLSLLHVLLLLNVSLLQLLGLLLVPLLHLLRSRFIGLPLRHPLVVLLLFLLESLVLLLLLRIQLSLLLLVLLVEFRVSRVRCSRAWMGCDILCVHWGRGPGNIVFWPRNRSIAAGLFGTRMGFWAIRRTGFSGRDGSAVVECSWPGSRCDRWPSVV